MQRTAAFANHAITSRAQILSYPITPPVDVRNEFAPLTEANVAVRDNYTGSNPLIPRTAEP